MALCASRSEQPSEARGHVRAFVIGLLVGATLTFFFSGVIVKLVLIAAVVLAAIVLARFL